MDILGTKKIKEDARLAAEALIKSAEDKTTTMLAEARSEAERLMTDAKALADQIVAEAQAEAQRRISEAEAAEVVLAEGRKHLAEAEEKHSEDVGRLRQAEEEFRSVRERVAGKETQLHLQQKQVDKALEQLKADKDYLEAERANLRNEQGEQRIEKVELEARRNQLDREWTDLQNKRSEREEASADAATTDAGETPEPLPRSSAEPAPAPAAAPPAELSEIPPETPEENAVPVKKQNSFGPIQGDVMETNPSEMTDRSDHVRVPNATVKTPCEHNLRRYHEKLTAAKVINVEPDDLLKLNALGLDLRDGILSGSPTEPGEYQFGIRYQEKGGFLESTRKLELHLLVNDDPRNMWKNLPTDDEAIFQKENTDHKHLSNAGFNFVGASRRGRSHAHKGTFRDDDFAIEALEDDWTLLAVSDGAGSSRYSREASRIICEVVAQSLREDWPAFEAHVNEHLGGDLTRFADVPRPFQEAIYSSVIGKAVFEATKALDNAVNQTEGTTIKDFYATLLFTVIAPVGDHGAALVSFGLGDGAAALMTAVEPSAALLNKPDGGDFAGQTVFLTPANVGGGSTVWERIRYDYTADFYGLFLMTDGVSDPFFPSDADLASAEYWGKFNDRLLKGLTPDTVDEEGQPAGPITAGAAAAHQMLEWLNFFEKGHHDDRTLVYALRKNQ